MVISRNFILDELITPYSWVNVIQYVLLLSRWLDKPVTEPWSIAMELVLAIVRVLVRGRSYIASVTSTERSPWRMQGLLMVVKSAFALPSHMVILDIGRDNCALNL
jgi:hypothetical protein